MARRKKLPKSLRKRENKKIRRVQFSCFLILMLAGFVLSLLIPLRPSVSESEKRELNKFPHFTVKTLLSGDYFDKIDLWYSDTFPFREWMVTANGRLKTLQGFGNRVTGLSNTSDDAIPDPEDGAVQADKSLEEINELLGGQILDNDAPIQELSNIVVVKDAAYELYTFDKPIAETYASIINHSAKSLAGASEVYDLIVPTSTDITLGDDSRQKITSSSQANAIRYIFSQMAPEVHSVNVYNAIRAHRTEYVYFRTDHHWTALGAYYAYAKLCETMGKEAKKLSDFNEMKFENFTGSFYAESGKNPKLGNNPDTIYAYDPKGETSLTYYNKNGKAQQWHVISDVATWASSAKYSTFIGGDNPYTYITNTSAPENTRCVVVKESFGNCFVPFLVADYAEVHVIDYRYWKGNVAQFAKEHNIDTVIYINNISATRSAGLMKKLSAVTF